ncbi:MAG: hypothetical protein HKM03_07815 [Steroidobacteraceae bacterium]|nr:hypothetical protein [Steroidobacteraceae bacterium]
MKPWIPLSLSLFLGVAAHAGTSCVYPHAPTSTPDGNSATLAQMIAAKHQYDQYNTDMNSYLACLKLKSDALTPSDPSKLKPAQLKKIAAEQSMYVQKNNAAVDDVKANVGRFNDQLKIYLAKHKKK